jgi:hypothetical protein
MNRKHFYIGIALIIIPLLGIYDFLKTFCIVSLGVYFIITSRDYNLVFTKKKKNDDETAVPTLPIKPLISQPPITNKQTADNSGSLNYASSEKSGLPTDGMRPRAPRIKKEKVESATKQS